MCRKTQLAGIVLLSFGLGILLSSFFTAVAIRVILGLVVAAAGGILLKSNGV